MNQFTRRSVGTLALAAAAWLCCVVAAEAVVGAPATPVSYAGVARRSTVGAGAPGVGATPTAGVGVNAGGAVNRVGPG
jgi:hypothetical protein